MAVHIICICFNVLYLFKCTKRRLGTQTYFVCFGWLNKTSGKKCLPCFSVSVNTQARWCKHGKSSVRSSHIYFVYFRSACLVVRIPCWDVKRERLYISSSLWYQRKNQLLKGFYVSVSCLVPSSFSGLGAIANHLLCRTFPRQNQVKPVSIQGCWTHLIAERTSSDVILLVADLNCFSNL